MIKLSELNGNQERIVRETTAPFVFGDRTETIRVRYFSLSVRESRSFRQTIQDRKDDDLYLSDILLPLVESLPDIVDDNEKPVKIDAEFLDSLNTLNLRAIQKAIEDDIVPKQQPSK